MTKHDQQAYTNLFARPFMPFTGLNDLIQPSPITSIWPIQNLLPVGLTLLSGESRSGKTSLALQLMLNVTQGQSSFAGEDRDDFQPFTSTRGRAFYLGLDHSLPGSLTISPPLPPPSSLTQMQMPILTNVMCKLVQTGSRGSAPGGVRGIPEKYIFTFFVCRRRRQTKKVKLNLALSKQTCYPVCLYGRARRLSRLG